MNYWTFAFGFVCVVFGVNGADKHLKLRQKCFAEVGLEKDGLAASGTSTFLQNPKSKCYLKCFLEGVDAFDKNNSFDVERSVLLVAEDIREQVHPLLIKCARESDSVAEKCEKSWVAGKCLYDAAPDIFQRLGALEPPIVA